MKKLILIILTVVMLLATVITVNAASFSDVKSSDWFYTSVNYVADKGIMQGTSSANFSPKTSLSRAMGVTLLYRVAGTPSVSGVNIPFADVKSGTWYTDAVKWAYKNGIVTGKSNTYFDTNGNITRAEFATILNRYSDFMNYTLPSNRSDFVKDVAEIPTWAFAAVTVMYKAEIINGKSGGIFDPNANITRAEAAAMIERFMKAPKNAGSGTETTPPIDNDPIPTTGKLVIKEKKYDYNGANVMILNVENQSNKNLTLTITAKYLDGNGKTLKTEARKVEGFPANYRNYVVLQPGIKFDKFSFEVKATAYNGETYMQCFSFADNPLEVGVRGNLNDTNQNINPIRAEIYAKHIIYFSGNVRLNISMDWVLFDNDGNVYIIGQYNGKSSLEVKEDYVTFSHTFDNIYINDFDLPNNVNNDSNILVSVKTIKE